MVYIKNRYMQLVSTTESDYRRTTVLFMLLTNIITIAGILITALVSINQVYTGTLRDPIFWITWSLTILVTISNKILYAYGIDKKYIINYSMQERLKAEGWKFADKVGIYDGLSGEESYRLFVLRIEEIQARSAESAALFEFNDTVEILDVEKGPTMRSRDITGAMPMSVRSMSSLSLASSAMRPPPALVISSDNSGSSVD